MAFNRVFLGWSQPGLLAAVDYLVQRYGKPATLDLRGVVVVVPGGRAGRRLLELLVERAEALGRVLLPPDILTQGRLPELLYRPKRPFAGDLVQRLAWVETLRGAAPGGVKRVIPNLPDAKDLMAWLALGDMLARLHRELAADALDFAAVAECGARLPDFHEVDRWQALAEIQRAYLRCLDDLGLWDLQTARLVAIRQGECKALADLVLLATADMNRAERLMLDQVEDRVTSLVAAPEEFEARFDRYGCLRPEAWRDAAIALADEQIEVAGGPADQAAAAVRAVASWNGRYSGEQITLGVPDAEVIPYLEQALRQAEVPCRYGAGTEVARSSPCRLLAAAAQYLDGRRFSAFAALARHADLDACLARDGLTATWLCQLDDYYENHLPYRIGESWLGTDPGHEAVRQAHHAIETLLGPLAGRRPLGQWQTPVLEFLLRVYGAKKLEAGAEPDRTILAACEAIRDALEAQAGVPESLAPSVTGAEALRLLLDDLQGAKVPAMPVRGAVELLGWLELPLDDAPALVVTGLNDGRVPQSASADLFLPNRLRAALGIEDNDRRYARDAYALSVLAASRAALTLIAARRAADGSPLAPSRLLFACDPKTAARRVTAMFAAGEDRRPAPPGQLRPGLALLRYEPPPPRPLPQRVTWMRVTEFRDYLACPYRYYLRHRLELGAQSDEAEELDGAAFGSLAHAVLRDFGESELAASTDCDLIYAWLSEALDQAVRSEYGPAPLSAILVQAEQLRLRLKKFAEWQARRASEGWRILCVEAKPEEPGTPFLVDGEPMYLRGRIDRIDVREPGREACLLDYKTSDTPRTPEQAHRRAGQWVDLQLPLYRHLLRTMGVVKVEPRLAYLVLPKDISKVGLLEAEWSEQDFASADEAAAEVIRRVRREVFWPPAPDAEFFEEFAAICGEGPFGAALAAAQEGGEEP